MAEVLYMEWEVPTQADGAALRSIAGPGNGVQARLGGSRGVHASFWLVAGPRLVLIIVLDSLGMLDAYAGWSRLRVQRLLGVTPSRQETFALVGAAEGAAGLADLLGARPAA